MEKEEGGGKNGRIHQTDLCVGCDASIAIKDHVTRTGSDLEENHREPFIK